MPPLKVILYHACTRESGNDEKYGMVADSISQLRTQIKDKFNLSCAADKLVVRLEDRTIVDDEDYFSCLDPHTCVYVSESADNFAYDEVDGALENDNIYDKNGKFSEEGLTTLHKLTHKLQQNLQFIGTFCNKELEAIANAEPEELRANCKHLTIEETDSIQQACHSLLVEREKTADALSLLEIYQSKPTKSPSDQKVHKKPRRSK